MYTLGFFPPYEDAIIANTGNPCANKKIPKQRTTFPETNIAPENNFIFQPLIFRGNVPFREGIIRGNPLKFHPTFCFVWSCLIPPSQRGNLMTPVFDSQQKFHRKTTVEFIILNPMGRLDFPFAIVVTSGLATESWMSVQSVYNNALYQSWWHGCFQK